MNSAFLSLLGDASSQKPPPKLEHRGNTYTQLSTKQQPDVYEELLKRRHSLETLRMELHIIENEELPSNATKKPDLGLKNFAAAPKGHSSTEARKAVAIDCEWGEAQSRRRELLAICAIDVLTGEILIESLVSPSQHIRTWRHMVHGITPQKIRAAVKRNQCLQGWQQARKKLFEHIDRQTILIGYTTRLHLELLRMFHTTIVDSQVLVTSAIFGKQWGKKPRPQWPMPRIRKDFLGKSIQQNAINESCTESVLENALVSREIALQCIQRPKDFKIWARVSRAEYFGAQNEKNADKEKNGAKEVKKEEKAKKTGDSDANSDAETIAFPIPDNNQAACTFSQGYEAGYQAAYSAAFQSGFEAGYEKGLKKANSQENRAMTGNPHQSQTENEHTRQESIQHANREEGFNNHSGGLNQNGGHNNDNWAPA